MTAGLPQSTLDSMESPALSRVTAAFLLPLALLAGTALYLHVHWQEIPDRFPVHWTTGGTPNGWSERTIPGVYGPLLIGAVAVLLIGGMSVLTVRASRPSTHHKAAQIISVLVASVLAIGFSMAAILPLHFVPMWAVIGLNIVSVVVIGGALWRSARGRSQSPESTPDVGWYWNRFYSNSQDPALFVEKRVGLGWTFNFGHRISWLLLALLLLVPAGLVLLALRFTSR